MKTLRVILKEKGINQKIVADALGVDVTTMRRYDDLSRRSVEEVLKISEATKIPFAELMGRQNDIKYVAPYIGEALINVPHVSAKTYASFIESLYSMEYDLETYGVRPEDDEDLENGNFMVFDIEGDSMYPTIQSGSKVLCEKICDEKWEYAKGVIVIVYGKTLTIKRILKNDLYIGNALTLKADNSTYGEVNIEKCEIRGMWQAVRVVSMKII